MADQRRDPARSTGFGSLQPPFRVVRRGFDRQQVLEHVSRAEERAAELESRLEEALIRLAETRRELLEAQREPDPAPGADRDPYEGVSEHMMELVRGFDREVERLRRRAELDATVILAEARTEAARMRLQAQREEEQARAHVEQLIDEARREAESVRAQLAPLRELTIGHARAIRDRMRISLLELDAMIPADPTDEQVIVLGEASEAPLPPLDVPPA